MAGPAELPAAGTGRRTWVILGVVIFVAVIAAAAFIGLQTGGALTAHHDIAGTFELIDSDTEFASISMIGGTCEGNSGYSDIGAGTPVTLKDDTGKVLASTSLGTGTGSKSHCSFSFKFTGVPEVAFYTVSVGRRGDITDSLADMKASGWTFSLTMGD
jgi:hypothetical protein